MSSTPKPNLHIRAMSLGPVATLDADLSKFSQNLVYARNGTGNHSLLVPSAISISATPSRISKTPLQS